MSDANRLMGKVAAILNERELVINLGASDGVQPDMRFRILGEEKQITDPDSGEALGALRREKIRVRVVEVRERLCTARTYQTYTVKIGEGGVDMSLLYKSLLEVPRTETRTRTLRYSDADNRFRDLAPEESFVKIGDVAEQITDEE